MIKQGTTFIDRNDIRAFVEAGNTNAAEIGQRLSIATPVVQRCIDGLVAPPESPPEPVVDEDDGTVPMDLGEDLPDPPRRKRRSA